MLLYLERLAVILLATFSIMLILVLSLVSLFKKLALQYLSRQAFLKSRAFPWMGRNSQSIQNQT